MDEKQLALSRSHVPWLWPEDWTFAPDGAVVFPVDEPDDDENVLDEFPLDEGD